MTRSIPPLLEDEVHVWLASLDQWPGDDRSILSTLSTREQERACRFRRDDDKKRYVYARWLIHRFLSTYLATPVDRVELVYDDLGKPRVDVDPPLFCNWSHSGRLIVLAFTRVGEVGVDVELLRPLPDVDLLTQQYLTTPERHKVMSHAAETRSSVFIQYWTRKEAYLKALGTGLTRAPNSFTVIPQPQPGRWRVMDQTHTLRESIGVIQDLTWPGHTGAVTVLTTPPRPRFTIMPVSSSGHA